MKLDLGCGNNKRPGYVGVDIQSRYNPDILGDIVRLPLADECASHILCSHVLEHLSSGDWHKVMREIARLLEPDGQFEIRVPHPSWDEAMILDHRHVLTPYMWRQAQKDDWLGGSLIIDSIEEVPNNDCMNFVSFVMSHVSWDEASKFLRNAFIETIITGHKP
jgi:ubiquinone/menaquinone biosynthesis C-methylase UbiE